MCHVDLPFISNHLRHVWQCTTMIQMKMTKNNTTHVHSSQKYICDLCGVLTIYKLVTTSISANRYGTCSTGASHPIDHCAVYRAGHRVWSSTTDDLVNCRSHLPTQPSLLPPDGTVNSCWLTAVAAQSPEGLHVMAKFSKSRVRTKVPGEVPLFMEMPKFP